MNPRADADRSNGLVPAPQLPETIDSRQSFNKAKYGSAEEGAEIMKEFKGAPAPDAGLLSAAQAVEYYEISRYGTLRIWAEELGMSDAAELLQATLEEEEATDRACHLPHQSRSGA